MRPSTRAFPITLAAPLVAAAVLLGATRARAEPTAAERVAARQGFEEGVALETKGDFRGALARFREVERVVTTPNVLYHLGVCLESTGSLVEALDAFERAFGEEAALPHPDTHLTSSAREHAASLRKRIPRVVLRLPSDVPRTSLASVSVDGVAVATTLESIPLDPGDHRVTVRARDRGRPFEAQITLPDKDVVVSVDVALGPADAPAAIGPAPGPVAPPAAPPPPSSSASATPGVSASAPPAAYVTGGLTVLGAGGAIAMFALRAGAISELDDVCGVDRRSCPPSYRAVADRGATYGTLGSVFVGVGVAAGVATVVLVLAGRRPHDARAGALDVVRF